ncbi:MAG: fibronectin type III domain-containing protein [Vicinamibacterales bacterium]
MRVTPFVLRFVASHALALSLAAGATPAAAQDRLFVGTGELGAFGHFGERLGPAPDAVYGRLVGGGRYVVGGTPFDQSPAVFDTRTGQLVAISPGQVVEVDPVQPRLFINDGAHISVWDVERRVLTPLAPALPNTFLTVTGAAYAPAVDELFVWSRAFTASVAPPIFVVDVGRATTVRTLTIGNDFAGSWRVTPDGTRLVVSFSTGGTRLVLYDGHSGAALASRPVGDASTPVYDASLDRWYDVSRSGLTAFDRHLTPAATVPFEQPSCVWQAALSLHTRRLYVTSAVGRSGSSSNVPMRLRLRVFDTVTGALLGDRDITTSAGIAPGTLRCFLSGGTAVLTAPGPPRELAASAVGRDITLSWTRVGDASQFVLDVGLAPGRTDLTFGIGVSSPVTFAGVPPGTYYLRVRGTNEFGVSRPSNEVAIVVP